MVVYIENHKESMFLKNPRTNKWVQEDHRMHLNIQSVVFLYTSTEHIDTEIQKYNTAYSCSKEEKCLGVNLTKRTRLVY